MFPHQSLVIKFLKLTDNGGLVNGKNLVLGALDIIGRFTWRKLVNDGQKFLDFY